MSGPHGARRAGPHGAPPPLLAGRYRLGERLGAGAQSEVLRAVDERLQREVAVKLLYFRDRDEAAGGGAQAGARSGEGRAPLDAGEPPCDATGARPPEPVAERASGAPEGAGAAHAVHAAAAADDDDDDAADPASRALERFRREAEAIGRLRHEGIVRVFDSGVEDGTGYLVMELIEGDTLAARIRAGAPLEVAVRAVAETAEAVAYAHEQGLLHRDLKPANVLIDRSGRARVVDFGLALDRSRETRITRTGELLGTPAYLSPEAARGQLPDERTDVYGLGAMLYEALTGRPPFTGHAAWQVLRAVLDDDPTPPRALDPKVPWDLEAVALRALEKHPIHRYPSARSLADDLHRYLRGEPVEARRASLGGRLRWAVRRYRQLFVALGVLAVFGLGLLAREPGLEAGRVRRARAEEILARAAHAQTLEEEIHLLEQAVAEDPGYSHALLQLGEARARAARAAAADGADPARAREVYLAALRELERAARGARRPIAALAWCVRGQTIEALGGGDAEARAAAEGAYAEAARHDLGIPATLFARARLEHRRGRVEAARSLYDELLREDAFHALGFARRAELRLAGGDREGALADAVRAVELAPDLVEARLARAAARAATGDGEGAARDRAAAGGAP